MGRDFFLCLSFVQVSFYQMDINKTKFTCSSGKSETLTVGPPSHALAQLFVNLSIATLTLRNLYVWRCKSFPTFN